MRVFVPVSWDQLEALARGPVRLQSGHAVTDGVRRELAGADDEELDYAVLTAAAAEAVAFVTAERPRRVVLAVDTEARPGDEPSRVTLVAPVNLADVAALHVDSHDAVDDVLAAAAAPDDAVLVDRALDRELGWYGVQELQELLAR